MGSEDGSCTVTRSCHFQGTQPGCQDLFGDTDKEGGPQNAHIPEMGSEMSGTWQNSMKERKHKKTQLHENAYYSLSGEGSTQAVSVIILKVIVMTGP